MRHGAAWAEARETRPHGSNATVGCGRLPTVNSSLPAFRIRTAALHAKRASQETKGHPRERTQTHPRKSSSSSLLRLLDPMEGGEARCPGDPMDFPWSADWAKRACTSPDGEAAVAPVPPAPSLREAVESMILVSGPRVVMSGLIQGDCRAGGV